MATTDKDALGLPELSLPGNLIGLGVNAAVAKYAWGRGGWWRVAVVLGVLNSMYFIGRITRQV